MQLTDRLVLPSEVLVFPVRALAPPVRAAIGCAPDEFAVTRRRSRRTTRIIDQAGADLLNQFRHPTSIVEAVRRFTDSAGLAPEDVVEACLPMLAEMISDGFIVPLGSDESLGEDDLLRAGSHVGRWEILEPLQRLEDSDVYRVQADDGTEAVLKRVISDREPWLHAALRNERAMLERLAGTTCPEVLEDGTDSDPPHLVLSWCEGVPVSAAAAEVRRPWSLPARQQLAALCTATLDAYVAIHERGVLHGDVHPHNLLYDAATQRVHLIDLGLAADLTGSITALLGGGVQTFVPPEVAAARLAKRPEPDPTAAAEQYAVATLVFGLLTGQEPLAPALEEREWLERVLRDPPRPFSVLAMPPTPATEAVLARALAKEPAERFGSVAEFRDAFVAATDEDSRSHISRPVPRAWSPPGLFDTLAVRLAPDRAQALPRPTATVNQGAAGVAYFLYRASCVLDRADLVAAADVWIERAKRDLAESPADACFDPRVGLDATSLGSAGFYHSGVGVHCVDALVACVLDDRPRAGRAVEDFVAALDQDGGRDDRTSVSPDAPVSCWGACCCSRLCARRGTENSGCSVWAVDFATSSWRAWADWTRPWRGRTRCSWASRTGGRASPTPCCGSRRRRSSRLRPQSYCYWNSLRAAPLVRTAGPGGHAPRRMSSPGPAGATGPRGMRSCGRKLTAHSATSVLSSWRGWLPRTPGRVRQEPVISVAVLRDRPTRSCACTA